MATILEVKGNDINVEVEKLSMSLTKLGCRGTFNKRFLISFFKQQNLENAESIPKAMTIFGVLRITNSTDCVFNLNNWNISSAKGIICAASCEKQKSIKACIDFLKENGYVVRTK